MRRDITLSFVWLLDAMPPGITPVALRGVREGLRAVAARYEILLVTRDVAAIGRRIAGADPYVRVIVPGHGGDGPALAAACAAASGDYVLVRIGDEDPQWDALAVLLPYVRQGDITLGFSPATVAGGDDARRAAALGFLYGAMPRAPFAAAQFYRAELVRGLTFVSDGPLLRVELLAKAKAQGATLTEVAVGGETRSGERDASAVPVGYPQAARLWLHLTTYRPPWIVRERPPAVRPPSEYVAGGIALAAGAWAVRRQVSRLRRG